MFFFRRLVIFLLGLALLALPTLARDWGYNDWRWQPIESNYTAPEVPDLSFAATPMPTPTPLPVNDPAVTDDDALRRGPVVVDFAHFSFLNPGHLQPLADALADRGLGLRYWISQVDTMALESSAQFPDQSADLAAQLKEASALVVISPFFLWTPQEIAVAERFVADGGRLLLVSDPDVMGDFPSLVNILAEPFGVVFNDDYLYDTSKNDGNFTFFFSEGAETEALADATIAFYGGRSISGAVIPQMHSVESTLSSLRTGKNNFTTVAIGGVAGRGTAGRVLALSDFDVLTEAYRVRYDNQRMVEFVADFLSAEPRNHTMPDFPNYLGKTVALSYGTQTAIGADLLAQGAQLQKRLEESGRILTLTNGHALAGSDGKDLIYLADYTTVYSETTLLTDLGIQVITEAVTITLPVEVAPVDEPTPEPEATPVPNEELLRDRAPLTGTTPITPTRPITAQLPVTNTRSTPAVRPNTEATEALTVTTAITEAEMITTSAPETRVVITTYLVTAEGLRFLADETVLVAQSKREDDSLLLAVLGADRRGIDAGVTRLLTNDFSDCVIGESLTFCSLPPSDSSSGESGGGSDAGSNDEGSSSEAGDSNSGSEGDGSGSSEPSPAPSAGSGILLIDDNRAAADGESSEADLYLQTLLAADHNVDLWGIKTQNSPTADDLANYAWVIWSNGGYADGKLSLEDMDLIFGYIRQGGRLTVSSRFPLPGLETASTVRDVVVDSGLAALTDGLPDESITLSEEQTAADLSPLAADESGVQIALRRGPESDNAEAPIVAVLSDAASEDTNARFMIVGMAVTGLPEEAATTLINNMATWMLVE